MNKDNKLPGSHNTSPKAGRRYTTENTYGATQTRRHALRHLARPLTAPLILLLAAWLRFHNLSGQSLWADEGNSVALARRGFVEIARRTAFDIHPPLYYWLLKIWISIFGDSEIGLRSLSVVLGIGLVYLIGILGTRFFSSRVGLIAALITALSPLQVYYSQEARMYMLLTFLGSLTALAALVILESYFISETSRPVTGFIFVLAATAGLYTHYAYSLILLAINLVALVWFWQTKSPIPNLKSQILNWTILQLVPLLLFLPWLPIAWRQITTWPSGGPAGSLLTVLEKIPATLLFGLSWPYSLGLIPAIGLGLVLLITLWLFTRPFTFHLSRCTFQTDRKTFPERHFYLALPLLWLWFVLPVALTTVIFSLAFLKFLLAAAPPLILLLTLTIDGLTRLPTPWQYRQSANWPGYLAGGALLILITGTSAISLYHYYTNPAYARDNYRGMASFIKALGGPEDAVILNAEGQQDVFNYYYDRNPIPSAPVYPLPRQRPLDRAATLNELQHIAATADKIYAVFWATEQADPQGLIEGWLNSHLFKATDQWYGNVRLVSYATPQADIRAKPAPVYYQLGQHIRLTGYVLSSNRLTPGDILQLVLEWQTDASLPVENYTVFVQILDQANHLVGQRDAQPLIPASDWPVDEPVTDAHGVFIEPGTPPGKHRLIVGLYNSETGQRLPVSSGDESNEEQGRDFIELTEVDIIPRAVPLPLEAFNIQVPLNTPMLEVTLLGYDLYKGGHRSTPDAPLHPGDPVHLVAYWTSQRPVRWLEDQLFIQVVTNSGRATPIFITRSPAGTDYPIKEWREGEIIRAQYDFFLNNLKPGTYRLALTLNVIETSMQQVVALTGPFRVE